MYKKFKQEVKRLLLSIAQKTNAIAVHYLMNNKPEQKKEEPKVGFTVWGDQTFQSSVRMPEEEVKKITQFLSSEIKENLKPLIGKPNPYHKEKQPGEQKPIQFIEIPEKKDVQNLWLENDPYYNKAAENILAKYLTPEEVKINLLILCVLNEKQSNVEFDDLTYFYAVEDKEVYYEGINNNVKYIQLILKIKGKVLMFDKKHQISLYYNEEENKKQIVDKVKSYLNKEHKNNPIKIVKFKGVLKHFGYPKESAKKVL